MRNKLGSIKLWSPIVLALLLVTAGQTSAQQFDRISDLSVEADHTDYLGPCPRDIKLRGKLKVNEEGLGVVRYQFVHRDGSPGEPVQLTVNHKGVYTVEVNLRQTHSWSNQVFLRVIVPVPSGAPKLFDSTRITIKGQCQQAQVVPATVSVFVPPASGRFRVTLTGFVVNHQTTEGSFSIDGADDEVFVMVNFAELWATNNIVGGVQRRTSLIYGDTAGRRGPFALLPELAHPGIAATVRAGTASNTGGLVTGNRYPPPGEQAEVRPAIRTQMIPMILWEGELRQGGSRPNAAVIIPTIWENDNTPAVLNVWNSQVDAYLTRFARTSQGLVTGGNRRPLLEQTDTVLSTLPQVIDFDRPIGIDGDTFNPLVAASLPATFIPAIMFLTYGSAEEAASATSNSSSRGRGVIEITYRDGQNYGQGSYTIFLRVDRLP